jgi:hypothetical protein
MLTDVNNIPKSVQELLKKKLDSLPDHVVIRRADGLMVNMIPAHDLSIPATPKWVTGACRFDGQSVLIHQDASEGIIVANAPLNRGQKTGFSDIMFDANESKIYDKRNPAQLAELEFLLLQAYVKQNVLGLKTMPGEVLLEILDDDDTVKDNLALNKKRRIAGEAVDALDLAELKAVYFALGYKFPASYSKPGNNWKTKNNYLKLDLEMRINESESACTEIMAYIENPTQAQIMRVYVRGLFDKKILEVDPSLGIVRRKGSDDAFYNLTGAATFEGAIDEICSYFMMTSEGKAMYDTILLLYPDVKEKKVKE